MKTLLFTFFTCLMTYNCIGQDSLWLDNLLKNAETGMCHCTINDTSRVSKDSIYLEIIPPVYQWDTITLGEIIGEKDLKKEGINIKISSTTIKYTLPSYYSPKVSKRYLVKVAPYIKNRQVICSIEIPSRYIFIKPKQKDHNLKDSVITIGTVIQKSTIKIISKFKAQTTNNPTIAIPKHSSKWEILLLPTCMKEWYIIDIQERLIEKGYDCPTNDIIDSKTRQAIIQFQKDNNLPEGRLNIETLKKLGLL